MVETPEGPSDGPPPFAAPDVARDARHAGIVAHALRRSFGGVEAVAGVSLDVAPGEVVGLVGPNGAGKTTTMRMLATLLTPSSGRAWVGGHAVTESPLEVRRRLGYLTGDTGLYGRLNALEILRYFGRLHGLSRARLRQRIDAVITLLGLAPFATQRAETLSTGQKQRVSIARAVLPEPDVLVLDEPTSGLDLLAARDVLAFFRAEADRGVAVLLSTHVMSEVELIGDRALVLHQGRIVTGGPFDVLRQQAGDASLSRAFLKILDQASLDVRPNGATQRPTRPPSPGNGGPG